MQASFTAKFSVRQLLLLALLVATSAARARQKTLLDVTDKLTLFNQKDGSILDTIELRQFPYVMAVS